MKRVYKLRVQIVVNYVNVWTLIYNKYSCPEIIFNQENFNLFWFFGENIARGNSFKNTFNLTLVPEQNLECMRANWHAHVCCHMTNCNLVWRWLWRNRFYQRLNVVIKQNIFFDIFLTTCIINLNLFIIWKIRVNEHCLFIFVIVHEILSVCQLTWFFSNNRLINFYFMYILRVISTRFSVQINL